MTTETTPTPECNASLHPALGSLFPRPVVVAPGSARAAARHAPRFEERLPQQELDLPVDAAQLVRRPPFERGVQVAVEPQQEGLALRQSSPRLSRRACRC
jgi:hypothetical protein